MFQDRPDGHSTPPGDEAPKTPSAEELAVGQRWSRTDGTAKVTGATKYAWDEMLPGMLWGRVLRSPHPHARITHVDTSAARRVRGVHAVLTGRDLPPNTLQGYHYRDMPTLAVDRVRFVGDRVAAVAAETIEAAEEALGAIEVTYEPLPAVFDLEEAIAQDALLLHEQKAHYPGLPAVAGGGNVVSEIARSHGNVDEGFARAEIVVEDTFLTQVQHQFYMEPHNSLCRIDEDGTVHFWCSTKSPFEIRRQISAATGLPADQIVVHHRFCGGDFGGKGMSLDEALCYFLTKAAGRPVKMIMPPTEEFAVVNPRHPALFRIKTGLTSDGSIVARDVHALWNSGAYAGFKAMPTAHLGGATAVLGPYRIPNTRLVSQMVYTNTVPHGHMRAPGAPQAVYACETHTDRCAVAVGLDPLEFRRRNGVTEGDTDALGEHSHKVRLREVIDAAARVAGWSGPRGPNRGIGIAVAARHLGIGRGGCRIRVEPTGQVRYLSAMTDPGTGSRTIVQQMISSVLGVRRDMIDMVALGTEQALYDQGSGGSRVTAVGGTAAVQAAEQLRRKLVHVASDLLEAPEELISVAGGSFIVAGTRNRAVDFADVAAAAVERGEHEAEAEVQIQRTDHQLSYAAFVAEVTVDRETGQVQVDRCVLAQDVGFAVNPLLAEGQLQGGFVMGLGFAMTEELQLEGGRVVNPSLGEYKVPCVEDIPPLEVLMVENHDGPGPWGAKSLAELCHVGVAPAIANAIADAVGVWIHDLPITPEKVLAHIRAVPVKQRWRGSASRRSVPSSSPPDAG